MTTRLVHTELAAGERVAGAVTTVTGPHDQALSETHGELARHLQILLDAQRGFLPALSEIYATDLRWDFREVLSLRRITAGARWVRGRRQREAALEQLCSSTLGGSGFVLVRPAPDLWPAGPVAQGGDLLRWLADPATTELAQCHLFGATGFAQLCDDELDRPIPLFVRPWSVRDGLLAPRHWPADRFSESLVVQRLPQRRMVLLARPDFAL